MTMERRSAPIMILSLASSNWVMPNWRCPPRAANRAASLTRLARSAPENPGVPRAMMEASTSSARGTRRMCTLRICSRPRMSGSPTTTRRSKRPGRSRPGPSTSGRLVAAMAMTPQLASKPSLSTRSCFGDGSRSSWPPPRQPHPLLAAKAARAQQGGVQHIGAVVGGNDDDAVVGLEAIHFHQQLVQGLFPLVVAAAQAGPAMPAHGVDLIDKDDAGRLFLGLP